MRAQHVLSYHLIKVPWEKGIAIFLSRSFQLIDVYHLVYVTFGQNIFSGVFSRHQNGFRLPIAQTI